MYLNALRQTGVTIEPPSVNHLQSNEYFLTKTKLFLPLQIIKQIGVQAANDIASERKVNGAFTSIFNFWNRMAAKHFNKKQFEALVYSGACDCFNLERQILLDNFLVIQEHLKVVYPNESFISGVTEPLLQRQTAGKNDLFWIIKAKNYLGFYWDQHPVQILKQQWQLSNKTTLLQNLTNKTAFIVAMIDDYHLIKDKNQQTMAFVTLIDETRTIEIVLFHEMFQQNPQLATNDFVVAKVRQSNYRRKTSYEVLEFKLIPAETIDFTRQNPGEESA